ncbi:hypothetical protein BCD49_07795 [Pseudofrankia sp. EUN1h]|nr:hypothetical protein BCD49_07795 [Pseudofrankia sp. EUN1h]
MSPSEVVVNGRGVVVGGDADTLLRPQVDGVPFAPRTPVTEPFWAGCARGELLFQRCAACATPGFPPTEACRACLSRDLRWERSAGFGTLYSWTVVHRPVSPAFRTPYAPAIVTLDEGYQLMTCLVGLTIAEIRPELRLRVAFHSVVPAAPAIPAAPAVTVEAAGQPAATTLPYFEPAGRA